MAPGKWSISPEWVTSASTSSGFGAGYSSESFYYYAPKKQKPKPTQTEESPAPEKSIDEKFKEMIDWSQKAVDTHALNVKTEAILTEAKRVGNLKEK